MENRSLQSDVWNNIAPSSSEDNVQSLYLATISHLSLKIIYIVIGTVGVLDNLFVIIVFALFIKVTDKVLTLLKHIFCNKHIIRPTGTSLKIYLTHGMGEHRPNVEL